MSIRYEADRRHPRAFAEAPLRAASTPLPTRAAVVDVDADDALRPAITFGPGGVEGMRAVPLGRTRVPQQLQRPPPQRDVSASVVEDAFAAHAYRLRSEADDEWGDDVEDTEARMDLSNSFKHSF